MKRYLVASLAVLSLACSGPADPPWQSFGGAGDPFVVQAPGAPKSEDIREEVPRIGTITGRQYNWLPPSNRFYMVMYLAFPVAVTMAGDMQKAMSTMATGIAQRTKGTITSEKPVVVLGLPGTEYEIKMGIPGRIRMRTVESHGTIYLIAAGWPDGKESFKDEEKFFDSFQLK
jgi:hypothetical protein